MKTLKNIFSVSVANIIGFGTSFIIGFILPAIISVEDYGHYRQFTLYMTFSFIFNLGYNDGIYIKYGGKEFKDINSSTIYSEFIFILIFQFLIFIIMIFYSLINKNDILLYFSIATFFLNMKTFFQNYFQAIGEFKLFSAVNISYSIQYFLLLIFNIFILKSSGYTSFIIINSLGYVYQAIIYYYHFIKQIKFRSAFEYVNQISLFKTGIFILIGNMSVSFIGNIGNIIVNNNYPIEVFAQFSFQNSILNIILLIFNAISLVFFNVISKNQNINFIKSVKRISVKVGIIGSYSFFFIKFFIDLFLPEYQVSVGIFSISIMALPIIIVSNVLIVNLYKTTKSSQLYFIHSSIHAVVTFAFIYITQLYIKNLYLISFLTVMSYLFWYIFTSTFVFEGMKNTIKDYIIICSYFLVFFACTNVFSFTVGMICYTVYIIIIFLLHLRIIQELLSKLN